MQAVVVISPYHTTIISYFLSNNIWIYTVYNRYLETPVWNQEYCPSGHGACIAWNTLYHYYISKVCIISRHCQRLHGWWFNISRYNQLFCSSCIMFKRIQVTVSYILVCYSSFTHECVYVIIHVRVHVSTCIRGSVNFDIAPVLRQLAIRSPWWALEKRLSRSQLSSHPEIWNE